MYNQSYQDLSYSHAAVATPLENGGIGASVSYLSYGQINGYSLQNQPTGNVNAYSGVATLGGAWLGNNWSAGVNIKGVQGELANVNATGFASDFGVNLIYPEEVLNGGTLRFGATLRNLGTGLNYIQQNDPFPTEWRLGLAAVQMLDRKLSVSTDYGKARDNNGSFYAGAEFWVVPFLALRAGYTDNNTEGNGIRAGIGLRVKDLSFDYAYSNYGDLGMSNLYELTYRFGAIRPLLSPEERKILKRGKQALLEQRYGDAVLLFNSLIELEPHYKPARRLVDIAMQGLESDEKLAKNNNNFNYHQTLKKAKTQDDQGETADLEKLLTLGDPDPKTAQTSSGKASQP